jgi:type I restriction enzyme R subunit
MDITEKAFETHIVNHLCQVYGYRLCIPQKNNARDAHHQKFLCFDWEILLEFITAIQPDTWKAHEKQHGSATVRDKFLQRLTREIKRRGTLDLQRRGIKDYGCYFQLAYFKPVSTLIFVSTLFCLRLSPLEILIWINSTSSPDCCYVPCLKSGKKPACEQQNMRT